MLLETSFYDGEYNGDLNALTRIGEIEGSVMSHGHAIESRYGLRTA